VEAKPSLIIKFFGALRDLAGRREQRMKLGRSGATIEEILDKLAAQYGKDFEGYLFESKSRIIRSQISIMVNGQSLRNPESLKARVNNGDTIAVLPPISGG
jgi:MoaD family protein